MNKILCVSHGVDLDGWCSAAIVKYWHTIEKNKLKDATSLSFSIPDIDFIGYDYGNKIPDWKSYDEIIMCDISFDGKIMAEMVKTKKVIWCDHHISAIKNVNEVFTKENIKLPEGIRDEKYAACELTWKYFFPNIKVPRGVELLGLYDSFRHKKELDLLGQQMVLEFQYAARSYITGLHDFPEYLLKDNCLLIPQYLNDGKAIYSYLLMDAREKYEKKIEIELDGYKFCAFANERFNPINFKINYHDDGYDGALCFWYDKEKCGWKFSYYNDNGKVDCSLIAKKRGGGGHMGASGSFSKSESLEDMIKKLLK